MNNTIETALAIGEKYGVVRRPDTRNDLVAMSRMCAVHGRPWMAIYAPKANGHYKLAECARIDGASAGGGTAKQIPLNLIDGRWLHREKCPWCGADGEIIHCGGCKGFVCNGRVRGDSFRCHEACGFRGTLSGSYSSFTGVSQPSPAASRAAHMPGAAPAALPVASRAQLPSGRK